MCTILSPQPSILLTLSCQSITDCYLKPSQCSQADFILKFSPQSNGKSQRPSHLTALTTVLSSNKNRSHQSHLLLSVILKTYSTYSLVTLHTNTFIVHFKEAIHNENIFFPHLDLKDTEAILRLSCRLIVLKCSTTGQQFALALTFGLSYCISTLVWFKICIAEEIIPKTQRNLGN